jgi:hypothetical protein
MVCSNCKNTNNILVCSNCSNYICDKETCQISFPHHNDEIYVICQNCISEISAKLVPLVKTMTLQNGLKILKLKIKTNRTRSQRKASNH